MAIYCTYILLLLLITHWIHSFSLHSLLYSSENKFLDTQNSESQLSLIKRLRRWNKNEDNDEVEIPLNETILSVENSNDKISLNSILNSTLLNFETIELNSSIIEHVDDLINSTFQIYSNENTTMKYSLLRQDFIELNQTIISVNEDVFHENKTDANDVNLSSTIFNELIDINQTVTNDKNETKFDQIDKLPDEFQLLSVSQTTNQVEPTIATENNQTNSWDLSFNDKPGTILFHDSFTVPTNDEFIINSNITQKDAIIPDQELQINDTEIISIETNQNSNETSILSPKSLSIPICDQSCQCSKECPYGFEILNDTCQCDLPCKNYQCFGNDTCIVTDKGGRLCQPENETEHDRPIRCYQPRDAGYHDDNMRYHNRWYYNPDQDTCHLFVYRGLGGNENNFPTLHECYLECITCAPLPDPGECLGHTNMWYYDKKKNECQEFEYSGCKGNENKFVKKEECIDTCINRTFNL